MRALVVFSALAHTVHMPSPRKFAAHSLLQVHNFKRHLTEQQHNFEHLDDKQRQHHIEGIKVTNAGAAVNIALALGKLGAGMVGRSAAMIADAGHSLSDLLTDVVTIAVLRISKQPPDVDHPYGHGRFESVGSLIVSSLLVAAAASFGLNALNSLSVAAARPPPSSIALAAALISIVAKEALFRATLAVSRRTNSIVLQANAWHHRSDALSSVVALLGIVGAMVGGGRWRLLDPLAGLFVAAMVASMGVQMGGEALLQLTDTSDIEVVSAVEDAARGIGGVHAVAHTRQRSMGASSVADLSIQVDPMQSVTSAHQLAEEVRLRVLSEVPSVSEVLVHVDTAPHDTGCPLQTNVAVSSARSQADVEAQVELQLSSISDVLEVSSVVIHYLPEGLGLQVQVRMSDHLSIGEARLVCADASARLMRSASDITWARVHIDAS